MSKGENRALILMMRGALSELPPEDQAKEKEFEDFLMVWLNEGTEQDTALKTMAAAIVITMIQEEL